MIKMSKLQWMFIGRLAGWLKLSHVNFAKLSPDEYIKRLKRLGWETWKTELGHWRAKPPVIPPGGERRFPIGFSPNDNNWEKNWQQTMRDVTRYYPDMKFVWQNPFQIPKDFNPNTLSIDRPKQDVNKTRKVKFMQLNNEDLPKIKVLVDGTWKKIFDIDWGHAVVMFDDETLKQYRLDEDITIMD